MLKNYFLVAIRSFWRNKTFSLINILGLSIGVSVSLIIFLLVHYDFSFDKFEKDSALIYRLVADQKSNGDQSYINDLPEPMAAAIEKELTGIEVAAPFRTAYELRVTIPYPDAGRPQVLKKQKDIIYADARYFNLIKYTWLLGSPATSLNKPYQVVLTENGWRTSLTALRWTGGFLPRAVECCCCWRLLFFVSGPLRLRRLIRWKV